MFEEEFIRVQTDAIERALERLQGDEVDGIYLYFSQEGRRSSFNSFFRIDSSVVRMSSLWLKDECRDFLRSGLASVESLVDVCERYEQPVPTEVRLTYSVSEGKFTSEVKYDPVLSPEVGVREVLSSWMNQVKSSLG